MSFERMLVEPLPQHEAAAFFISVREPMTSTLEKAASCLDEFWLMSREEQGEILKEAGVSPAEFGELLKFAAREVDLDTLLGQEQEALSAQRANEATFYQQRSQQMRSELDAAQQQLQATQDQTGLMQQQLDGSGAQIQQAQQDAQMTQQAALTNMQAAQAVATQAMQQAVAASDEALKSKQMAAQMRMAMQGMRGDVMNLISQDPAADVGAQLSGASLETPAPPNTGGPPSPSTPGGPAPESTTAETGTSPSQPPTATPAAPSEGGAENQEPTPPGVKVSSITDKTKAQIAGGLLGGLIGGGGTALEASRGHDDLRAKIQMLEGSPGGFGHSVNLAKAKAMLAAGEVAEKHPVAATLAGSVMGAGLGAGAAPDLAAQGKKFFGRLQSGA